MWDPLASLPPRATVAPLPPRCLEAETGAHHGIGDVWSPSKRVQESGRGTVMAIRQTTRTRGLLALLVGVIAVTGCGWSPLGKSDGSEAGSAGPAGVVSSTAPAEPTYQLVTEPCQVL